MDSITNEIIRLRCRVESVIKGNESTPFFSLATVLYILSLLYGSVMALRAKFYEKGVLPSKTLPCRVVSIGNLVAGGTGKTPMTLLVAQLIRELGYRVVVISRGYGGQLEKRGGVVSDGETIFLSPEEAGDEPYLMAKRLKGIPVVVGHRRYEAGVMAIQKFNPDCIILDDAFQHLRLNRDLDLVLLDHKTPFGNGHILPRGTMREPLSALQRADAVLFTRSQEEDLPSNLDQLPASLPVFYTQHHPVIRKVEQGKGSFIKNGENIAILEGRKTVAFAGLADNDQFFNSLKRAGCVLLETISFSDHHRYDTKDLDRIAAIVKSNAPEIVVTTLKDFVKLESTYAWPMEIIVVDVQIRVHGDLPAFKYVLNRFDYNR